MTEYRWAVFTRPVHIFKKSSRQADRFMATMDGCTQAYHRFAYSIYFYDSLNNAKIARNKAEYHGIDCGPNIIKFKLENNELTYCDSDDEC